MRRTLARLALVAGLGIGLGIGLGATASLARAEDQTMSFTVVNIEYEGTKVWVPATLVVKKGTLVKLKLVNNVASDPNQHGFAIAAYKIAEVVDRGTPKTLEFKADKDGIFPITCQLHPAHIGGELVVLP